MKGRKITAQQIGLYMMAKKKGYNQKAAAAKSGISERSARNLRKRNHTVTITETKKAQRTREDPFENVWEIDLVPLLEKAPNLQAKTLFEDLQRKHPDNFPDSMLRTLYRRVRIWKALYGPGKELIFRQNHPVGWQGLSDFTDGSKLGVTIRGVPFDHILYHYWLAFCKWEYAEVILGGESFSALSSGLQNALWACGGAPDTHRTDSLSAAYKNLPNKEKEEFTEAYLALCKHYGMEPTRNNKGVSNENGSVEASHGGLKNRIIQALLIRGSSDFDSVLQYRLFIYEITKSHDRRINKAYQEELLKLKELPEHKTIDFSEKRVRVTSGGTINVCGRIYSMPDRLVGILVKVHVYDDRLECFVENSLIKTMDRIVKGKKYNIDYHDIIDSLSRKPQAFRNYIYKSDMFPTIAFQLTWTLLDEKLEERESCREYVKILKAAAHSAESEMVVHEYLEKRLLQKQLPQSKEVIELFKKALDTPLKNTMTEPNLEDYDLLLGAGL